MSRGAIRPCRARPPASKPSPEHAGRRRLRWHGGSRAARLAPPPTLAACRIPVWPEMGESAVHDAVHTVQPGPGVPAAAGCQGLAARARRCGFRGGGGGAGAARRLRGASHPRRPRAVSPAAAAGAADLQLRQRHLLLAQDRAGDASRHRRALRGGEPASRPRHHRRLPPRQPRRLRGSLPAGAAAGRGERPAAAWHGGDRRHHARRQRLQDPLGALRPGEGAARQTRRRDRRDDRPGRGGRRRGTARPAGAARRDRPA